MKYTSEQLKEILAKHAEWLADNSKGVRANLSHADFRGVNLIGVNLSHANMSYTDMSYAHLDNADLSYTNMSYAHLDNANLSHTNMVVVNLSYAHMVGVNLSHANMSYAHMLGVNLSHADLSWVNLRCANMVGVNLRGADMDYSSGFPLWCGGSKFKCEAKLIQQVLAHLCTLDCKDKQWVALRAAIRPFAKKSHRAYNLGLIKQKKG